jgi:hypothetical protein
MEHFNHTNILLNVKLMNDFTLSTFWWVNFGKGQQAVSSPPEFVFYERSLPHNRKAASSPAQLLNPRVLLLRMRHFPIARPFPFFLEGTSTYRLSRVYLFHVAEA